MSLDISQENVKNRLILWMAALAAVERSLLLAERATSWSSSVGVMEEIRLNGSNVYDYQSTDPYANTRKRPFPILFESDDIVFVSMSSAVVYYSQLLSTGNADGQRISSNSKNLTTELWEYSFSHLEKHNISKSSVETLNDLILGARNGVIAHADARQFEAEIDANGNMISFKSFEEAWESIDAKLWLKVSCLLKHEMTLLSSGVRQRWFGGHTA